MLCPAAGEAAPTVQGAGGPRGQQAGRAAREGDRRVKTQGGTAAGDAGSEKTGSVTGNEDGGRGAGRKVSLGGARVADVGLQISHVRTVNLQASPV